MPAVYRSCSICLHSIVVTAAGLIRLHGPVAAHCSGSCRPPICLRGIVPQPAALLHGSAAPRGLDTRDAEAPPLLLSHPCPPRPLVKILKCLPKALRAPSGKKFAAILDMVVSKNAPCFLGPPLQF